MAPVTATRTIRRVARTAGVSAAPSMLQSQREADVAAVNGSLKLIAEKQRKIQELAKEIENEQSAVEALMKKHKMTTVSDGVIEAAFVEQYTNEGKEVDPKTLFNKKGFPRERFFEVVKVQMGPLGKFMAEAEIRAIATITPRAYKGTELVFKPVKQVVTAKPASKPKAKK